MHSANCAEALSRLCMSFPADLQSSVRAQLADCLVGMSCQRLDFLSAQRLRVPRCEILLPSSGARGTIRAGNFSQIPNVLQSGGDEGMWTFDRYQRWMDQVTDWARPAAEASAYATRVPVRPVGTPPAPGTRSVPPASGAAGRGAKPAARKGVPADDVIEIAGEEMDLAQLAELAKKVVERKP
jgi:twitching motility protein PilT